MMGGSAHQLLKSYLCVDYPGLVENESEAIRTLGGMARLRQTFARRNTKLLLNFTPNNLFSKMLCSTQITDADEDIGNETRIRSSRGSGSASANLDETAINNEENLLESGDNSAAAGGSSIPKQNEYISMPCLLMSVKKSPDSNPSSSSSSSSSSKFEVKIIGKIKKVYTFQKIADFQYLPMSCSSVKKTVGTGSEQSSSNSSTTTTTSQYTYTAFYDNFLFNNIQDYDYEFRKSNLPQLFILPPFFSRFDDPVSYSFRSEPVSKRGSSSSTNNQLLPSTPVKSGSNNKSTNPDESSSRGGGTSLNDDSLLDESNLSAMSSKADEANSSELIRSMRQERTSQAYLVTFNCKEIPSKPSEKLKPPRNESQIECISTLKNLFKERPCYLKSVLLCITSFSASLLKESLPYVAYYFTTGPWRSCWVRFGYDPRQHAEAKQYQMIDYRLRNNAEPDQIVRAKPRSSYHKRKFRSDLADPELDDYKNFKIEKEMYKFNPNKLPMSRNVFYQICDIEDVDVQNLIKSDENSSAKCTEKDGWYSSNFQDRCRNIMSQKHEKLAKYISQETKEEKRLKK